MKYSQCRDEIKTGDVLVCAGNWMMSRAIRYFSGQDVSHVGIALWLKFNGEESKRLCMFEAMEGKGVRIIPLEHTLVTEYWPQGSKMWWQPITDHKYDGRHIMDYVIQQWGDGYVGPYQFIVGLSCVLKKIRKWRGESLDTDPKKWHCSKLVAKAFEAQGYELPHDAAICTPGDVSNFSCLGPRILLEPDNDTK